MRAVSFFLAISLAACGGASSTSATSSATAPAATIASTPRSARLTITTSGGNVTTTPTGIDCRSEAPPWTSTGTCTADFPVGTVVTFHWVSTMAAGFGSFGVLDPPNDPADCASTGVQPCVVVMDHDRTVFASAVTIPPPPGPPGT